MKFVELNSISLLNTLVGSSFSDFRYAEAVWFPQHYLNKSVHMIKTTLFWWLLQDQKSVFKGFALGCYTVADSFWNDNCYTEGNKHVQIFSTFEWALFFSFLVTILWTVIRIRDWIYVPKCIGYTCRNTVPRLIMLSESYIELFLFIHCKVMLLIDQAAKIIIIVSCRVSSTIIYML